jgi:hypothetical protein
MKWECHIEWLDGYGSECWVDYDNPQDAIEDAQGKVRDNVGFTLHCEPCEPMEE